MLLMNWFSLRIYRPFLLISCTLSFFILLAVPLFSGSISLVLASPVTSNQISFTQHHRQQLINLMSKDLGQVKSIYPSQITSILGVSPFSVSGNRYIWSDSFNREVEVLFNPVTGGVSSWKCRGF